MARRDLKLREFAQDPATFHKSLLNLSCEEQCFWRRSAIVVRRAQKIRDGSLRSQLSSFFYTALPEFHFRGQ